MAAAAALVMLWPAGALAQARTGALNVRVTGLPVGQAPAAVLTGPGVRQRLLGPSVTFRHARPGRYTLVLSQVRVGRGHGRLRAGATAYPASRRVSVRVRAGRAATLTGDYGTIVNPGLRALRVPVLGVTGAATHPRSLRLAGSPALSGGEVLSLPPSPKLPNGVLARVLSVSRHGSATVVALGPVSVFDAVPVAQFDVPVQFGAVTAAHDATAHVQFGSPVGKCGADIGSESGVYRSAKNARFSGGWNVVSVFGHSIPVGLTAGLDADLTAGLQDRNGLSIGASCEVDIPWQAMAGPVPVTGSVFGNVHGSVGGGIGFDAQLSIHVHAGVSTIGAPPSVVWAPQVSFSNPSTDVHAAGEVAVTVGFGAGVKFGLGSAWGAKATVNLNNEWDFTAQAAFPYGSGCRTEAKFASFNAELDFGTWSVESPSTPPLFTKTLWGPTNCEPHASTPSPGGGAPSGGSGGTGGPVGGGPVGGGTGGGSGNLPSVAVTPAGPTSGPSGLGLKVNIPACPANQVAVSLDGTLVYAVGPSSPTQMWAPDIFASVGTHELSFSCAGAWTSPGFPVHITEASFPQTLESPTVAPGDSLVFDSGASAGPRPCPALSGYSLMGLTVWMDSSAGPVVAPPRYIMMPDNASTESLLVPSSVTPGQYTAEEQCVYEDPSNPGPSVGFFFFAPYTVTVT